MSTQPSPTSSGSDGRMETQLADLSITKDRTNRENSLSEIESLSSIGLEQPEDIWDANPEAIAAAVSLFESQLVITAEMCSACQNVFGRWQECLDKWPKSRRFSHYSNIHFVEASARNGCRLCKLFVQSLEQRNGKDNIDRRRGLGLQVSSHPHTFMVEMQPRDPEDPKTDHWNVAIDMPSTESVEQMHGVVAGVLSEVLKPEGYPASTTSEYGISQRYDRAFSLAQQWMKNCLDSHKKCRDKNRRVVNIPTRLVYIGEGCIRLWRRPENYTTRLRYATLSHCWGKLEIFKLKKDNMTRFEIEIPYADLCKTFQDAINIARQFQIDYLWIDSLCIIQDDYEDWEKESSLMSEVYGGSHLNIAAASAKDGRDGCFFPRNSGTIFGHQVIAKDSDGEHVFDLVDLDLHKTAIFDEPLAKRAWAYQERVLAPRVLYFGKDQVFWECEEEDCCEDWPRGVPLVFPGVGRRAKPKNSRFTDWGQVIVAYSKCEMSFRKDKLIALSGVARNRAEVGHNTYVAGLWTLGLERQLTWKLRDEVPATRRPLESPAPSWSWASVDGWIQPDYGRFGDRSCIRVLDIQVQLKSLDNYGGVSGAALTLGCEQLVRATRTESNWYLSSEEETRWESSDYWANWDYLETPSTVFLLPTNEIPEPVERESRGRMSLTEPSIRGLILAPTGSVGRYMRLGTFFFGMHSNEIASFNAFRKAIALSKEFSKEWSCDYLRDDDNFVIELV